MSSCVVLFITAASILFMMMKCLYQLVAVKICHTSYRLFKHIILYACLLDHLPSQSLVGIFGKNKKGCSVRKAPATAGVGRIRCLQSYLV